MSKIKNYLIVPLRLDIIIFKWFINTNSETAIASIYQILWSCSVSMIMSNTSYS
jgi:hypothetical protein